MSRTSSEFWNESVLGASEAKGNDCDHDDDCDKESAKALKRIISLLDDLNNADLRLLDEIIDRLLCQRKR